MIDTVIAVPVFNNRIAPLFDVAKNIILLSVDLKNKKILNTEYIKDTNILEILYSKKFKIIICNAVSRKLQNLIFINNIDVICGITGIIDEVVQQYLNGKLIMHENKILKKHEARYCKYNKFNNKTINYIRSQNKMKIAISCIENSLESKVDLRFGRAKGFIIYDEETSNFDYLENTQNLNSTQGAGIQTAKNVIDANVNILITGHVGPKAFSTLNTSNIKIFLTNKETVNESIIALKNGELEILEDANARSHW